MNVLYLEHAQNEGPMNLAKWARDRDHFFAIARFYQGETPSVIPDLLIVGGGEMGAYEEDAHPWLADEKRYIARVIASGAKVLGICLGAQLLANVLGARVYRHTEEEIGWFPVRLTDEGARDPFFVDFAREFQVLHWHSDTFELPKDARLLATSQATLHQAFAVGDRVLGVQFHIETGREDVAIWMKDEPRKDILEAPYFGELEARMRQLLDRFD